MSIIAKGKIVSPKEVLAKVSPGMNIFLGAGTAEPRRLVKELMTTKSININDIELLQLLSIGDAMSIAKESASKRIRLKTFFSGGLTHQALSTGAIDLVPCRFSRIPKLMRSGTMRVDAVFVQVSPPDANGFVSLGGSADVSKQAIEIAQYVVGEINEKVPYTFGNILVHINEFDCFVESQDDLICIPRWPANKSFDLVTQNVASVIDDGSSLCVFNGPFHESLGKYLCNKKDLGLHSIAITDMIMDLIKSGVITNKKKSFLMVNPWRFTRTGHRS